MQTDVPEKLNKKLKIYSVQNNFVDKRDAALFILEKGLAHIKLPKGV